MVADRENDSRPLFSPESDAGEELSLDALAAAFAEAMGRPGGGAEPREPGPGASAEVGGTTADAAPVRRIDPASHADALDPAASDEEDAEVTPLSILEAMLFVGDRGGGSLAPQRAAELMRGVRSDEIPGLVDALNARYRRRGCPYEVAHVGAGYRLTLRPEFYSLRDRFFGRVREARLSQAALDVLAIVAYQQPVAAETVSALRGTPSHAILTQLVRRRLLRIERQTVPEPPPAPAPEVAPPPKRRARKRKAEKSVGDAMPAGASDGNPARQQAENPRPKRLTLYLTTERFLELFGLESLEDLPQSEELGE